VQDILYRFAVCTMSMSFIALLFILLSPVLIKRYGAKWQYYTWLIIIVGFIVPFRPNFEFTLFPVGEILEKTIRPTMSTVLFDAPGGEIAELGNALAMVILYQVIFLIWFSGLMVVLGFHILRHRRFSRLVRRWSTDIDDTKMLETVERIKSEMNISKQVNLKRCELISSPMITGFFSPTVLMPASNFSDSEFDFIISHELIHFKRKDMWYKCLVLIAMAIHWFNPVVYLMSRHISELCELSCDAEVVKSSGMQTRQKYTEAIIRTIQSYAKTRTIFSTNFYGGKKSMKKRISSILDTKKKRAGAIIMCCAIILTLGTGVAFAAGTLPPLASSGVPGEYVFEGAISRHAKPGGGIASEKSGTKPVSDDEAEWSPPFEGWKDFLTYDYDMGIYRLDGKWVRSVYDEWKNPDAANGKSASLNTIGYDSETGKFENDLVYGKPVDIRIVRNSETDVIEEVVVISEKEVKQIMDWLPYANEMDFDTFIAGGR